MAVSDLKLQVIFSMMEKVTAPLKSIKKETSAAGKEIKDLRSKLKTLENQQQNVDAFKKMNAKLVETANRSTSADAKVSQLAQAMAKVAKPTKNMTKELARATEKARLLEVQLANEGEQLNKLERRFMHAGIRVKDLGKHEQNLRNNMAATNQLIRQQQQGLTDLTRRYEQLAAAKKRMKKTQAFAGKMAMVGTGMSLAGGAGLMALKAPVNAYANAEDSKIQLKVSMMQQGGKVSPEFEKINALAMKLGDRLPGTTSDFLDMMTMLQRQGLSAQNVLGGTGEATALLAVQLKKTPAEAAEFAAKMQDATRTTEKDMLGLMDTIQRTFYLGVDDNNMLQAMSKLSPALQTLRKNGLEATKMLAPMVVMFDQAGMKGEAGGNALRKVLDLSMDKDKRNKMNKALKSSGVNIDLSDGKGEFAGIDNMFAQFAKLKSLNRETTIEALKAQFGDDGETQQVLSILIDKGMGGYNETIAKMQAQADLQTRVNEQLGTLKNLWDAATGTFTNALVAFGESIAPELKALVTWIANVSEATGKWARENPKLSAFLMKTVAIISIVLVVIGGLLMMISAILMPLAMFKFALAAVGLQGGALGMIVKGITATFGGLFSMIKFVGFALVRLGAFFLMNPIGIAIALIAGAAFLIYKYWDPICGFFQNLWANIKAFFNSGIDNITATITNWSPLGLFYQCFAGLANYFGIELPAKFTEFGGMVIDGLINGIKNKAFALEKSVFDIGISMGNSLAKALGIRSPSRVFMQLGMHTMDGLDAGLNKHKNKPLTMLDGLSDKMRAVGLSVSMAAIAPAATAFDQTTAISSFKIDNRQPLALNNTSPKNTSPTGDTIHISITPAPGADPQAIAKAVAAELDKRDRQRQHSKRSSLHDYDAF